MSQPAPAPAPAPARMPIVLACWVCAKPGRRCSRCKLVVYCSTACQASDWKRHSAECRARPASDPAPVLHADNPFSRYMARHPGHEVQIYAMVLAGGIADDHLLILSSDDEKGEWTTCEVDGAALAFHLDRPSDVSWAMDEHAGRAAGSTSVVVKFVDERTREPRIYYAQFAIRGGEGELKRK